MAVGPGHDEWQIGIKDGAKISANMSTEKKSLRTTQKRYSNWREQIADTPSSVSQSPKTGNCPEGSNGRKEKELAHINPHPNLKSKVSRIAVGPGHDEWQILA